MRSTDLDLQTQKWIKQGRGSGQGKYYQPWLTVRDLSSEGRSHRVLGTKTSRTHHLLSDLELAAFFLFDWHPNVTDIREQFPLRVEDTIDIAAQAGIKHPEVRGTKHVMSTDFLIDIQSFSPQQYAIQIKYSNDLSTPRTIEKLEIERRYWEMKSVPWFLLTEKQIPQTVIKNIAWLYPTQVVDDLSPELLDTAYTYLHFFKQYPTLKISNAAMKLDQSYSLEAGESLKQIRSLLAHRVFQFDITRSWSEIVVGEISYVLASQVLGERYAANQ